jgi:predicted RND superfamily exporter protein
MTRLLTFFQNHPRLTLAVLAVLSAVSVPFFLSINIRSDIVSVLPKSISQAQAYREQMRRFPGGGSGYLVLLEGPGPREVTAFGLALADSLKTLLPGARPVVGMDTAWVNAYALWLVDPDFLEALAPHVNGAAPHQLLAAVNTVLETWDPGAANPSTRSQQSPENRLRGWLDLLDILRTHPDSLEQAVPAALQTALAGPPVQLAPDGKTGFFAVFAPPRAVGTSDEFRFARQLQKTVARLGDGTVKAAVTGNMVLAAEESNAIRGEINRATAFATLLMIIFLVAVFRQLPQIVAMAASMLFATSIAAGLTAILSHGTIHVITASFLLLLLGMGIDYAAFLIHAALHSDNPARAMAAALPPLAIGTGTSIVVFLCLAFTGIPPLMQLGWVVALGLTITLVVAAMVAPAVMGLFAANHKPAAPKPFRTLPAWTMYVLTGVLSLVALGGAWGLFHSSIETDMRALGRKKLPAALTMDKIVERFNLFPASLQIICPRPDSLRSMVAMLRQDPLVRNVGSALDVLPNDDDRPITTQALATLRPATQNVSPDAAAFRRELHRFRTNLLETAQMAFLAGQFGLQQYLLKEADPGGRLALLDSLLAGNALTDATVGRFESIVGNQLRPRLDRLCAQPAFHLHNLPAMLRERYFPADSLDNASLVYVSLHRDIWKREVFQLVQRHLSPVYPGLTGSALLSHMIIDLVLRRGGLALAVALVICFIVVLLYLRSLRGALFGMFPIVAAICASGYVFYTGKLLDIPLLNYISACSLVLITGIGMEYSVRALAVDVEGRGVVAKSLFASGVLSIMGFGGIAFCSHAGLRGFGLVLCIGLVICLVFALVVNAAKRE